MTPFKHVTRSSWYENSSSETILYRSQGNSSDLSWRRAPGVPSLIPVDRIFRSFDRNADDPLITYNREIHNSKTSGLALKAFKQILANGLQPNTVSYNALLNAYANEGDSFSTFELVREMKAIGVERDQMTYASLIKSCNKIQKIEIAKFLMKEDGVSPNDYIYNCLIQKFVDAGKSKQAFETFDEMKQVGNKFKIKPGVVTYTALFNACRNGPSINKILELWDEMNINRVWPNERTYISFITACISNKNFKNFEIISTVLKDIFNEIKEGKTKVNEKVCTALINAFLELDDNETAFVVHEFMQEKGFKRNI